MFLCLLCSILQDDAWLLFISRQRRREGELPHCHLINRDFEDFERTHIACTPRTVHNGIFKTAHSK